MKAQADRHFLCTFANGIAILLWADSPLDAFTRAVRRSLNWPDACLVERIDRKDGLVFVLVWKRGELFPIKPGDD